MRAITTPMAPMTLISRLAQNLREVIQTHPGPKGTVVKVVEKLGTPILARLAPNNPFQQTICPKEDCLIPSGSCKERCGVEKSYIRKPVISMKTNNLRKKHHPAKLYTGSILEKYQGL